jgi:hypothetical protein
MTAFEISYYHLFGHRDQNGKSDTPAVERIQIPLIQRDYAQGRSGESVDRIRANFLDALHDAVTRDNAAISLDFVYGDVKDGTFYPLDGQQRLTTLFLLHWYLAIQANCLNQAQGWKQFSYATRPGARLFCERIVQYQPPADEECLSAWIKDQAWYLHTWRHDPTIQSMLVMIDTIHERFRNDDCTAAWNRLIDTQRPAISFHLLPMEVNGLTDDLYIKMNSRGKPLTIFENFKAHFEQVLEKSCPSQANHFAQKVDTEWADTLWAYRGGDNLVDDEFMNYFRFVTEVCAWQDRIQTTGSADTLSERVYGEGNTNAASHLEFLFKAFDVWHKMNIKAEFENIFTVPPKLSASMTATSTNSKVTLFNAFKNVSNNVSPVDLFAACCQHYARKEWSFAHTLLLYAVLLHRIHNTLDFPRQLRILRNLIEASGNEIRYDKMPELLADVKHIIVNQTLREVTAFNQAQITNENDKAVLLAQHRELQIPLYGLEDHVLLRGCLAAFHLDPSAPTSIFMQRAEAFQVLFSNPSCWPELTGALLATGDYSRTQGQRFSDFGAPKNTDPWRGLLTGSKNPKLVTVLMSLLDQVATANNNLASLQIIQQSYLQHCTTKSEMGWRYYFVKYPAMREGDSGRYVGLVGKMGYSVCMLDKTVMRSYYRDPYLLAILRESGVGAAVDDPWFYGYESEARRMRLKKSGVEMQCIDKGLQLTPPEDAAQRAIFDQICAVPGTGNDGLYTMPQNASGIDTADRVELGANLLRDLVNAGL